MKKAIPFIVILFFIHSIVIAQTDTFINIKGNVVYDTSASNWQVYCINKTKFTKEKEFDIVKEWVLQRFSDPKKVIISEDKNTGSMVCKLKASEGTEYVVSYNLNFEFKDHRFKISGNSFSYLDKNYSPISLESTPSELPYGFTIGRLVGLLNYSKADYDLFSFFENYKEKDNNW